MNTKNLIKVLSKFPPTTPVSLVYSNGALPVVAELESVHANGGPSLYAKGWNTKSPELVELAAALELWDCDTHIVVDETQRVIDAARAFLRKGGAA